MSQSELDFGKLFQENENAKPKPESRLTARLGRQDLECGQSLEEVEVAYETWGELNQHKSNAILVCHALTGDSHCTGWWANMVGPGRPIDTDRYFVICSNSLGGCQGSTGPASLAQDGKKYGTRFPHITVGDMVNVQARLLDHLGIERLLCVAGGSMGGMQAIEWSVRFPSRVQVCFATAACARHNAMQIGFNETARQAIMRDPDWQAGNYQGEGPINGLAVSRMIGHLTFLSEESFALKFGRRLQDRATLSFQFETDFQVESYLNYQGDKFSTRFDANSMLYITKAIDYFDRQDLLGASCEFLFVSYSSDWIYPSSQSEELHQMAQQARCASRHLCIDLPFGHDSFLLDGEFQGSALTQVLSRNSG